MNNENKNDFDAIWNLIYNSMRESGERADQALSLWFSDTELRELTSEKAVFTVATEFRYNTVVSRYLDTLKKGLESVIGYLPKVEVVLDTSGFVPPVLEGEGVVVSVLDMNKNNIPVKEASPVIPENEKENEDEEDGRPKFQSTAASGKEKLTYNPDYTFDNFVVGGSNNFAHAAAKNVAEHPAVEYNPFFLYGPSGVGKTHLMYAITNRAMELYPDMNITFVKGEEFANQLIECLSQKYGGKKFRDKYRTVDILLIDDVHFIAGRESIQEEFFHTFNTLFEGQKQIIVSSDRPPRDMHTLELRLRTRFESGLLADMQSPDYDLRLAIIRRKALNAGISLSAEVEKSLAKHIGHSVRQIEGIIKKISARFFLTGESPSLEMIEQLIPEYVRERNMPRVTPESAIEAAAEYYGVTVEDILGDKRDKNIRLARNAAMYVIKHNTHLSNSDIGKEFNRNHSTVINNCKAAQSYSEAEPKYKLALAEIEKNSKK